MRSIAQALLTRRLDPERPIAILSGNSIEHGLIALAAMTIGQPYAPIAPSYSLASHEHVTLRAIWASLDPQLVFVADPAPFARRSMPWSGRARKSSPWSPNDRPGVCEHVDSPN